jgi:hypothetical protein
MTPRELLFRVIVDGHDYRIFTNGEVEGFHGESVIIVNHFHVLETQAFLNGKAKGKP